ncbi:hypothetical protein [Gordonia neofelifaecis]|uniref:Uncharacterized protein n=1 Tax=Gordonia neofelifaecis NRRL B-59395 TaxID=644548 RepID=F1YJR1_9ACTN|nr:hypothetical protein [Gordonia neofelifaecis]EGD54993.1 hypothetical protein SCNU_10706 [Gordonia neofelifaecis NRRL B-59395]
MPDYHRVAGAGASAVPDRELPIQVRVSGMAVAALASADPCVGPAREALTDGRVGADELSAVIHVAAPTDRRWSADGVRAGLGLGGSSGLRVLDVVDDGCGVPSSIAVGSSLLAYAGGAVLVSVPGAALVLTRMPGRRDERPSRLAAVESAECGRESAVERVLAAVGDRLPIVASVPGGVRLSAGRRYACVNLAADGAASIAGLVEARSAGHPEVVLVTSGEGGQAAAVVCVLDRG